ncbi:MAG: hypothetical protein FJX75_18945 [Armatimonadetes bacterium]|nr:hypothetical protein [Armatimonadota bacterium]
MSRSDSAATTMGDELTSGSRSLTQPTPSQLQALWVPIVLFIAISVADTISSVYMLLGGLMEEYNPLMRWVWHAGGVLGFVSVKAFLTIVPVWLFNHLKSRRYGLVYRAVWLTVLGYAAIYALLFCLANY